MEHWETVWQFNTARYTVALSVSDEESDPADSFSFEDDVEYAREGGWHWFCARVQVIFRDENNPKNWAVRRDLVLGEDFIGGCSYEDLKSFRSDGYFRDMVAEAISEARGKLSRLCSKAA